MQSSKNPDLVSTSLAGETLGISVRTVQLWVDAGLLPAWKTAGGHRRISFKALEQLVKERQSVLSAVKCLDVPSVQKDEPPLSLYFASSNSRYRKRLEVDYPNGSSPLIVTNFSDVSSLLIEVGRRKPDAILFCADDFEVDAHKMALALCAGSLGLGCIPIGIFFRHVPSAHRASNASYGRPIYVMEGSFRKASDKFIARLFVSGAKRIGLEE